MCVVVASEGLGMADSTAPQYGPLSIPEDRKDLIASAMQTDELRKRNASLVGAIKQITGTDVEITDAKLIHLMVSLVHRGIIKIDDCVEIQLDWEKQLLDQLTAMIQAVRDQMVTPKGVHQRLYLPGGKEHHVSPRPKT